MKITNHNRFYCEKLKQLSKTTQTMSKEKEIRSFLPNVDVVKFMEDDEYKKFLISFHFHFFVEINLFFPGNILKILPKKKKLRS